MSSRTARSQPIISALRDGAVHLCGHRGHSISGLENSVESLDLASKFGATMCEIDVQITSDGHLAAFHDLFLDSTSSGLGPLWSHPSEHVFAQDAVSRLDGARQGKIQPAGQLLARSRELELSLILEPKCVDLQEQPLLLHKTIEAVSACGMTDQVVLSSFDFQFLRDAKAETGTPTCGIVRQRFVDLPAICASANLDIVLVDFPYLDEVAFKRLRDDGVSVAYFVPNPDFFEHLQESGRRHLDRLASNIGAGLVSVLGCDDVKWGREFLDSIHSTRTHSNQPSE